MSILNLLLNFAPVTLTGNTSLHIGCRPYTEDRLNDLRAEHWQTHVFKREAKDDTIIDIPVAPGAEPLGNITMEVDLKDRWWYWRPLLRAALVRAFYGKREIARDYPVEVLGDAKRNLISHERLPDWVQQRSLVQFVPRTLYSSKGSAFFGLLCDVRTRNLLLSSCEDLIAAEISPIGRYVLVDLPARDQRIADWPQNVGRVRAIDGDTLILEDHRDGFDSVAATSARLTANRTNFDWCVSELLGAAATHVLNDAANRAAELHRGPGRVKMIEDTLAFLRNQTLEAVPGAAFQIGTLIDSKHPGFPTSEMIDRPTLLFDPSGMRTDHWSERGLKDNGPYDQRTFRTVIDTKLST